MTSRNGRKKRCKAETENVKTFQIADFDAQKVSGRQFATPPTSPLMD